MAIWDVFSKWTENPEDAPLTDPESAQDSVVGDAITRFQKLTKEITDRLAVLSAARIEHESDLQALRQHAILAYSAAQAGDLETTKQHLEAIIVHE